MMDISVLTTSPNSQKGFFFWEAEPFHSHTFCVNSSRQPFQLARSNKYYCKSAKPSWQTETADSQYAMHAIAEWKSIDFQETTTTFI